MKFSIIACMILITLSYTQACDDSSCFSEGGECNNNGTCICDKMWITSRNSTVDCNYKQKEWLTALLLQIFLGGVGAGNFYTGNIQYAVPQLLLGIVGFVLGCVSICVFCCCARGSAGTIGGIITIVIIILASLITSCWWLADVIRYAMDVIPDGNGEKLYHI